MKFSIIDGRSPRTIHYSIQFKALFRVDINYTYNTGPISETVYIDIILNTIIES
jgi:hypothetical protein